MSVVLKEMMHTLETFQLPIFIPESLDVDVEIRKDNKKYSHIHHSVTVSSCTKKEPDFLLMSIFIHQIMDIKIDSSYGNLIGESFYKKYSLLPKNNEFSRAIRETYRIVSRIRNIAVHKHHDLRFQNSRVTSNYKIYNRRIKDYSEFCIDIGFSHLKIFYGIAYMYAKYNTDESEFNREVICSMYKTASEGIEIFNDEHYFDTGLSPYTPSVAQRINWRRRYFQATTEIILSGCGNFIKIFNAYEPPDNDPLPSGVDYCVNIGKCRYIVPSEFLEDGFSISMKKIEIWKISGEKSIPFYLNYHLLK